MLCYKDKTFCASPVTEHSCGRELNEAHKTAAQKLGLPIAYGYFCP